MKKTLMNYFVVPALLTAITACGSSSKENENAIVTGVAGQDVASEEKILGLSDRKQICMGSSIPSGYVIVGIGRSLSCGSSMFGGNNQYTIGKPQSGEVVCSNSTTPSGWVVTAFGSSLACGSNMFGGVNTKTIKIPGREEVICSSSPIPSGYLIVGNNGRSLFCGSSSGVNTIKIRK